MPVRVAWAHFLLDSADHRSGTLVPRLAVAIVVVIWAARTSRPWAMAPAMLLAMPVLGGFVPFSVLAAVPRLLDLQRAKPFAEAIPGAHEQPRGPGTSVSPA